MSKRNLILCFIGVFVASVIVRVMLINAFATSVPLHDYWHVVIVGIYQPVQAGSFDWRYLFQPWQEHRLVWDKLYELAMFKVFGTFNNARVAIVNSVLFSGFICWFFYSLTKRLTALNVWPMIATCAAVLLIPYAQENTITGFQFQAYASCFFIFCSAWCFANNRMFAGSILSVLGIGALANGYVAAFAFFALCCLDYVSGARRIPKGFPWVMLAMIAAVLLYVPTPSENLQAHAQSLGQFLPMFLRYLSWPCLFEPWAFAIVCLPCAYLLMLRLAKRTHNTFTERLAIIFFSISILNAAMIAYARTNTGAIMFERYQDYFTTAILAQVLALYELRKAKQFSIAMPSYACACFIGLGSMAMQSVNDWRFWTVNNRNTEAELQLHYLKANHPNMVLQADVPWPLEFDTLADTDVVFQDSNLMQRIPGLWKCDH